MIKYELTIPENVEIKIENNDIIVKGPLGETKRTFKLGGIKIKQDNNQLILTRENESRKKQKAYMGSITAHIKNMARGVTEGHKYKLKVVYKHFPINISQETDRLIIKNFAGEKTPRYAKIREGVKLIIKNEYIELEGKEIEDVGQTAANIEQATRIRKKDIRIFQDGIFIIKKSGE